MALRVMLVDDEPEILKMIAGLVEPMGCEVAAYADSREAASQIKSEKFDGIFVDVRMPYLDGFQLTQRIRASALNHDVPIVMLTGLNDTETMRRGFELGVTIFLGKPVTPDRVRTLFNALRGAMLREKRGHVRLPLLTAVNCSCGEQHFQARSLDISEGGMMLEAKAGLMINQLVDLEMSLPGSSELVKARAKVVRQEPPDRVSVKFTAASPEDQGAIRRFIFGRVSA